MHVCGLTADNDAIQGHKSTIKSIKGSGMARDGVANIVHRLRERGYDPHRVESDAWESRCPVHRGTEHALAITRDDQDRVVVRCRSRQCLAQRILSALDLTVTRLYAGTPNWVLRKLSERPIVPSLYLDGIERSREGESRRAGLEPVANAARQASGERRRSEPRPPGIAKYHLALTSEDPQTIVDQRGARADYETRDLQEFRRLLDAAGTAPAPAPASRKDRQVSPSAPAHTPACREADRPGTSLLPNISAEQRDQGPMTNDQGLLTNDEGLMTNDRIRNQHEIDGLIGAAAPAIFFRLADGRLLAQLQSSGRQEFYGLKSAHFRDWLVDRYIAAGNLAPSKWSIRRALNALDASAPSGGAVLDLSVRVGRDAVDPKSPIYIDRGDQSGAAVAIDADGWSIINRPRVAFRRPEGFQPLPVPIPGGSIELLRPYVNLSDRDFRLLVVWLAAALRPTGPYPILALFGEQGSAKSTLARIVRLLVDPNAAPLLVEPNSTRDLMITALNGWILAYDNISTIPRWLADGLCVISTGGAYAGRTEYTSVGCTSFQTQRPIILNGIDDLTRRGDLCDRSVMLHLPPIPPAKRRREDELWKALDHDRPRILGALLDAIVGGLRELPNVQLAELPRMADFAAASDAVGRGLGWPHGTILADYEASRLEAAAAQIEDSLLATVLVQHAASLGSWTGSPADLHAKLTKAAGRHTAASARWPKATDRFAAELRRIAPQLRMHGINLTFGRTSKGRFISLELSGTEVT
jgi:hypothetical protein